MLTEITDRIRAQGGLSDEEHRWLSDPALRLEVEIVGKLLPKLGPKTHPFQSLTEEGQVCC